MLGWLANIVATAVIFVKPLSEYNFVIINYHNREQFSILFRKISRCGRRCARYTASLLHNRQRKTLSSTAKRVFYYSNSIVKALFSNIRDCGSIS